MTALRKPAVIFSKLYGAFRAHIIRDSAGRKIKMIDELFTIKNFEYTFVLFVSDQSLLNVKASLRQTSSFFSTSKDCG